MGQSLHFAEQLQQRESSSCPRSTDSSRVSAEAKAAPRPMPLLNPKSFHAQPAQRFLTPDALQTHVVMHFPLPPGQ